MPTEAEFNSAMASMAASSAWINGTEAEREALARAIFEAWDDIWDTVGGWWYDLWQGLKQWLVPPKSTQKPISQWFQEWWAEMFPITPLLWSSPPGGGSG